MPRDEIGESPEVGGIKIRGYLEPFSASGKTPRGYAAIHAILPDLAGRRPCRSKTRSLDFPLIATSNSASMCPVFWKGCHRA